MKRILAFVMAFITVSAVALVTRAANDADGEAAPFSESRSSPGTATGG